jgi:hypothetical protein
MLDSVITAMAGRGRPWFATHKQIADLADSSPTWRPTSWLWPPPSPAW